jgi:hypothetical protein
VTKIKKLYRKGINSKIKSNTQPAKKRAKSATACRSGPMAHPASSLGAFLCELGGFFGHFFAVKLYVG